MADNDKVTASDALAKLGFDGDKLMAYAQTIARRELNRTGSTLGNRYEDLVMYLVEVGCKTAVTYDPKKSSNTYKASSYVYDVMARRVPDFYRKKSEGFGDRRKGHDNRIELVGLDEEFNLHRQTDALAQLIDTETLTRYSLAAERAGVSLANWIHDTLEAAA